MENKIVKQEIREEYKDKLTLVREAVLERVSQAIQNKRLIIPENYNVNNAISWVLLQLPKMTDRQGNRIIDNVKVSSIVKAIFEMVVQGLDPIKNQVCFIPYKGKLICQRTYFGNVAVLRRVRQDLKDIYATVVYQDDVFEYSIQNGRKVVIQHKQKLQNIDKDKIIGAYAVAIDKNDYVINTEIMTLDEILTSWSMSTKTLFDDNGNLISETHMYFMQEMCKRTVINRLVKFLLNSSIENNVDESAIIPIKEDDEFEEEDEKELLSRPDQTPIKATIPAVETKKEPEPIPEPISNQENATEPENKPKNEDIPF
jgi:recombination protein RecT